MPLQILIEFSISRDRLRDIVSLYEHILSVDTPQDVLDNLLYLHAKALHFKLHNILNGLKDNIIILKPKPKSNRKPKNITFTIEERDAYAFIQFWKDYHIPQPLPRITIESMIGQIDKQSKQPKFQNHG